MKESLDSKLELQLVGVYESLNRKALQITAGKQSDSVMDSVRMLVKRWADSELRLLGENNNLALSKNNVLKAFERLVESFSVHGSQKRPDDVCGICGGRLARAYYDADDLVCVPCAQPVIAALDDLVCISTSRFSPDKLMKIWKIWKADVDRE